MKRLSPTLQITLGLVLLTAALIVVANAVFGVLPDRTAQTMKLRKAVSESLAVQVAALLQGGNVQALERHLGALGGRIPDMRSIAVRRADRTLLAWSGDHEDAWSEPRDERSTLTHIVVPLSLGDERWGALEMTYTPDRRNVVWRVLGEPLGITLLFVVLAGLLVYWLYMRRALLRLDPAAVIPERVRLAFDVMTEAVVLLDLRGRILLANNAFRSLHGSSADPTGKRLSALPWLAADLPDDPHQHPWVQTMLTHAPITGHAVEVRTASGTTRKLIANCAPVTDHSGVVRGCIATLDDVTALHITNERLRETLVELAVSRDEIANKNRELERMATRDHLTGCLNRRAFFAQIETAVAESRKNGTPLSCLMLDIDRFKSVNDTYGHGMGDRVIQEVAKKVLATLRTPDIAGRYGGEEFCIGLPNADLDQASAIAERLRRVIEEQCGPGIREIPGLRVTTSVGVATLDETGSISEALERADQALYRAKRAGRNRVCRSDQDLEHTASAPAPALAEADRG